MVSAVISCSSHVEKTFSPACQQWSVACWYISVVQYFYFCWVIDY